MRADFSTKDVLSSRPLLRHGSGKRGNRGVGVREFKVSLVKGEKGSREVGSKEMGGNRVCFDPILISTKVDIYVYL